MDKSSDHLPVIVGIRFSPIGKSYYFDASSIGGVKLGDFLVVETSRGWQLGELVKIVEDREVREKIRYKPVSRLATPDDMKKKDMLDDKAAQVLVFSREIFVSKKIKGVKVISAEFTFDEKVLSFLYTTENEKQIKFDSIIRGIKEKYHVRKIDFHKIGPRDVAKYYGGMGACGLETRCCSRFLNKFESISIRMAKTQGISLTPSDITGMCNRLRCCLGYEYCNYVEALKGMPKRNKRVKTPMGIGKVKDLAPLRKTVFVALGEHGTKEFGIDEIEAVQSDPGAKNPNVGQKPKLRRVDQKKQKKDNRRRSGKNSNPNQSSRKK